MVIDRIFLIDHNWKQFTVKYDVAGVWTDFTSVVGIDGAKANISETTFADDTAYYEFAPVTTGKILVTVTRPRSPISKNTSIRSSLPKRSARFMDSRRSKILRSIATSEKEMLSGKVLIQKSEESFKVDLDFQDYPGVAPYNADTDLIFGLHDREDNFIIWICGGRRGSAYFKKTDARISPQRCVHSPDHGTN